MNHKTEHKTSVNCRVAYTMSQYVGSTTTMDMPRLPACQNCSTRKIKCDSQRPKCAPCTKSGAECLIVDLGGGPPISREYIHELEQQVQNQAQQHTLQSQTPHAHAEDLSTPNSTHRVDSEPSAKEADTPSAVLRGGGLSFMSLLFTDPEWRRNNTDLLENLTRPSRAAESVIETNSLASADEARFLFDAYLGSSHVQNPFLLRDHVQELYLRVFSSADQSAQPKAHDLFRAYMIVAIGSVISYRKGIHGSHPFGYYLSAMTYFEPLFLSNGLEAIQDLLLICRFGIYHQIGTSIWELIRLCMRISVELGLHHQRHPTGTNLLEEQIRRRVVWSCYVMDRNSSTTLNRPFAIPDEDIDVGFPADANDAHLVAATGLVPNLDAFCCERETASRLRPSEMSVMLHSVRLRQISSQIHREFSRLARPSNTKTGDGDEPFLMAGKVFDILERMSQALTKWRSSAPVFENPTCLFERQEWYDLLQVREKFHLVKKAVDLIPKHNSAPSKYVLNMCLQCAIRTISLYSDLYQQSMITYTRSYFQMIFAAGLSVLFCLSVTTGMDNSRIQESFRALFRCKETLVQLASPLPEAKHYVAVFEALYQHISQKLGRVSQPQAQAQEEPQAQPQAQPSRAEPTTYLELTQSPENSRTNGRHNSQTQNSMRNGELWGDSTALSNQVGNDQFHDGSSAPQHHALYNFDASSYVMNGEPLFHHGPIISDDDVDWGFLSDDNLWNMGSYVYGDPSEVQVIFHVT